MTEDMEWALKDIRMETSIWVSLKGERLMDKGSIFGHRLESSMKVDG